jgi:hypothetical protein
VSINVIQLIQCTLSGSVVRQLCRRFGRPGEATDKVISAAAPARVAARMHKGATLEGARSLFTTTMAPEVNAHIGAPAKSTPTPTAQDVMILKRPLSRCPSTQRQWARLP